MIIPPLSPWDIEAAHVEEIRQTATPVGVLLAQDYHDFPVVHPPPAIAPPPGKLFTLSELLAAGGVPATPLPASLPPGDPLARLQAADVVFGFDDTRTGEGFIFHGRDLLARLRDRGRLFPPEDRPVRMVAYALNFASTDLHRLIRMVKWVKGSCCYSPDQIPIHLWWPNWSW